MSLTPEQIEKADIFCVAVTTHFLRRLAEKLEECQYAHSLGKPMIFLVQRDVADRAELEVLRMLFPKARILWWDLRLATVLPELQDLVAKWRRRGAI